MSFVLIDYETKSACDLKKCGAWVYSEHFTTDLTFLGYSFNGDDPILWSAGNFMTGVMPDDPPEDLFKFIQDEDPYVVAHNAQFEKAIWTNVAIPRYLWPERPTKWIDTMAVCARKALPLKLELAAMRLNLFMQKNMEGANTNSQIMKPHKMTRNNPRGLVWAEGCEEKFGWDNDPKKYYIAGQYCKDDILAEVGLLDRIGTLSTTEQAVWELDQIINERGVMIDQHYVSACQDVIDQAIIPLAEEFAIITGGLRPTQRDKCKTWMQDQLPETYDLACDLMSPEDQLPNTKKDTMADFAKRKDLPEDLERVLEIRGDLTSTSIAKVEAMRRTACKDGKSRGLLQYHAASPGRWGGRLLQPQNFPRGTVKPHKIFPKLSEEELKKIDPAKVSDQLVKDIMKRDAGLLKKKYGSAIQAVSSSLRHGMIASPGHVLCVGDFASIEARIVLALGGDHDKVELIKTGADIYNVMATTIYGYEVDRKTPEHAVQGQVGKNTVLGCGFQMGWKRFKEQVKEQTGLEISAKMAQDAVNTYREDFAPGVKALWGELDRAATRCVWDRQPYEAAGILYQLEDAWMTARLPSGRKLYYYNPQPVKRAMPWDEADIRPGFTYQQMKAGQWKTIYGYGGLLTENVVQATARDLMVDRMFAVEFELGYPIILTVHDELVTEPLIGIADPDAMEECMNDAPPWAVELNIPVASECWVGDRYRK